MTVFRVTWSISNDTYQTTGVGGSVIFNQPVYDQSHKSVKLFSSKEAAEAFSTKLSDAALTLNMRHRLTVTTQEEQVE